MELTQAQEDQLEAQIVDDLTTMVSLAYSAAEAGAEGATEVQEEYVEAYVENLGSITHTQALLMLDKAISVLAGQFAIETGRSDLVPDRITLDDMPPLD